MENRNLDTVYREIFEWEVETDESNEAADADSDGSDTDDLENALLRRH